ncbi:MAG: hypothetical protein KDI63_02970 [Gammaproteobacteria bacterium]|nr:hypothetical protein [Gammaproteobacteria bacterium]
MINDLTFPINPELCSPSYLYNRSNATEVSLDERRISLEAPHPEFEPDLVQLQETDPESYRMVVYSWA